MPYDLPIPLPILILGGVLIGIPLVTAVAMMATALFEKHALRTWRAENAADEPMQSAYTDVMNAQAAEHGFVPQGAYRLSRGGKLKFRGTFWFSPERDALAIVSHGKIGPMKQRKTLLFSRLADGRWLATADEFGEADISRVTDSQVLYYADFGELVERHWQRLDAAGAEPQVLAARTAEEAYFELEAARQAAMLGRGLARVSGDHWKYSLRGALRVSFGFLWMQQGAKKQVERARLPRPGDRKYKPRYSSEVAAEEIVPLEE